MPSNSPQTLAIVPEHEPVRSTVCDDLLDVVRGRSGTLSQVGNHTTWAISAALGRCASGWQHELTDSVTSIRTSGGA